MRQFFRAQRVQLVLRVQLEPSALLEQRELPIPPGLREPEARRVLPVPWEQRALPMPPVLQVPWVRRGWSDFWPRLVPVEGVLGWCLRQFFRAHWERWELQVLQ